MAGMYFDKSIIVNIIVIDDSFKNSSKSGPIQIKFDAENSIKEFTFLSLLNKISEYFEVDVSRIGFKYLDEEGDFINVSTDEEWFTTIENACTLEEEVKAFVYESSTFNSMRFGDWSCTHCTYVNNGSNDQCDMCLNGKIIPTLSVISNAERACDISNSLVKLDDDPNEVDPPQDTNPPPQNSDQTLQMTDGANDSKVQPSESNKSQSYRTPGSCDIMKQSSVSTASSGSAQFIPKHKRIYCSNCEEEIVRIRYKCGNCAVFNLCSMCEIDSVKLHNPTHVFVKIFVPLPERVSHKILIPTNLYTDECVLDTPDEDENSIQLSNRKRLRDQRFEKSTSSIERSSVINMYYNNDSMESDASHEKLSAFDESISSGLFDSTQPDYSFKVIKEMNFPHGSKVNIDQIIKKSWIVENNGRLPWTRDKIQLRAEPLLPECIKVAPVSHVPVCKPHRQIVLTVECQIVATPPQGSSLTCHWLMSPTDEPHRIFGETLLLLVNTEKEPAVTTPSTLLEKCRSLEKRKSEVDSCEEELRKLAIWNGETVTNEAPQATHDDNDVEQQNLPSIDTEQHSPLYIEDKSSDETESFCVLSPGTEHDGNEYDLEDTYQNLSRAAAQLQLHTENQKNDLSTDYNEDREQPTHQLIKDAPTDHPDQVKSPAFNKRLPSSSSETDHSDFVIVEPCSLITTNRSDSNSLDNENALNEVDDDKEKQDHNPDSVDNVPPESDSTDDPKSLETSPPHLNNELSDAQSHDKIDLTTETIVDKTGEQDRAQKNHPDESKERESTGDFKPHCRFPFVKSSGKQFSWENFSSSQESSAVRPQSTWMPSSTKWLPSQPSWTPQQAPAHTYQYESNLNMRKLLEMGFCDRKVNQELLIKYHDDVERVVAHLVQSPIEDGKPRDNSAESDTFIKRLVTFVTMRYD